MNFLSFLRPESTELIPATEDIRPASELEKFANATSRIINGLDDKIDDLDREINMKIGQLSDLRRIRESQALALRHMEGNDG